MLAIQVSHDTLRSRTAGVVSSEGWCLRNHWNLFREQNRPNSWDPWTYSNLLSFLKSPSTSIASLMRFFLTHSGFPNLPPTIRIPISPDLHFTNAFGSPGGLSEPDPVPAHLSRRKIIFGPLRKITSEAVTKGPTNLRSPPKLMSSSRAATTKYGRGRRYPPAFSWDLLGSNTVAQ